jgi:predicted nucleotidyltransferase
MTSDKPTQFPELNGLLHDFRESVISILEDNFVGGYLVGSFALGDADIHSDCDFLIVARSPLTSSQEAPLRKLHTDTQRSIPTPSVKRCEN